MNKEWREINWFYWIKINKLDFILFGIDSICLLLFLRLLISVHIVIDMNIYECLNSSIYLYKWTLWRFIRSSKCLWHSHKFGGHFWPPILGWNSKITQKWPIYKKNRDKIASNTFHISLQARTQVCLFDSFQITFKLHRRSNK